MVGGVLAERHDFPPRRRIGQVPDDRGREIAHADAWTRGARQHRKEPPPQHRVGDGVANLIPRGFLPVEVLLQQHVVRLGHRLDQPGAELLRIGFELLRDVLLDEPAELSVLPARVGVRPHRDQVDDAAERVAEADGELQRDGLGLERLLDVVERPQEAGAILVQLVHARDERQRALRRHVPMRFRLVLDTAHGRDEQKAALDDAERPICVRQEVGEAGGIEQVEHHAVVLCIGDVRGDGEVALRLLGLRVEVAGRSVLAGPRGSVMPEQGFREGRFSSPVVRDDRHVANLLGIEHGNLRLRRLQ